MPLRDHFHPPLDDHHSWDSLHGAWPTIMVMNLKRKLPKGYVAVPRVHLVGAEVDVGSFEKDDVGIASAGSELNDGGAATAVWSPPKPTFDVIAELPDQDEYEVQVYDTRHRRRLVASVEIISPSNVDRPDNRRAFVGKCASLLRQRVSVAIVDLVTIRHANLYSELLEFVDQSDRSSTTNPPATYAAACRWTQNKKPRRFQSWTHPLSIGAPLPTLPLWLTDDLAVPLELESTYEEACSVVSII